MIWADVDGNAVDYDVVFELREQENERGIPVAFFETFWRRGSRHSKDKARDDSGKLIYMRDTYPTARMLAIVAAGDFTRPAQDLVRSRNIVLWYTSKRNIVDSWADAGVQIDYPDKSSEDDKQVVASAVEAALLATPGLRQRVASNLFDRIGAAATEGFTTTVFSVLSAAPQEYVVHIQNSSAQVFADVADLAGFLAADEPVEPERDGQLTRSYRYEVFFGDGDVFVRDGLAWLEMRDLHQQLKVLIDHMDKVASAERGDLHLRRA